MVGYDDTVGYDDMVGYDEGIILGYNDCDALGMTEGNLLGS